MNLSPHFTLAEMLRSEAAARSGISMEPSPAIIENLRRLAMLVLEPIRVHVGVSLYITSGYRPPGLNAIIGGAPNSDHMFGLAADIVAGGINVDELGARIREIQHEIPLKKCIREFSQWIHVSCEPSGVEPRREFLTANRDRGRTIYADWVA